MNVKEYKNYHEEHMMHNTGTSAEECCLLISAVPFYAFLSSCLVPHVPESLSPIIQFLMIILPIILNCTILSDVHHIIFLNVLLLSTALIIMKTDVNNVKNILNTKVEGPKSFISNFRASTNFVSAICILAVDFMVFPKRFSKTESFGFGFMDLGVGFFICANGFVEKHCVTQKQFSKILKTESILCILGLIRVFSVKATDYHEHVSEYGVHWNFFFTLALCRLLSHMLVCITNNANPLYLSVITGVVHQALLLMGLQQWVLIDKPRDSFLTANREGLVSCLGYISLYFAASSVGKYIFHAKDITYKKLLFKLFLLSVLTWVGTGITFKTINVSRRLVNLGYIFWILASSLTESLLFLILEICLLGIPTKKMVSIICPVPSILESINAYGLPYFIISNLLTGLVNMIFQTLLLGEMKSMIIIISYMAILCSIPYIMFIRKLGFNQINKMAESKKVS